MKKILFVAVIALMMVSCKKETAVAPPTVINPFEKSEFRVSEVSPSEFQKKSIIPNGHLISVSSAEAKKACEGPIGVGSSVSLIGVLGVVLVDYTGYYQWSYKGRARTDSMTLTVSWDEYGTTRKFVYPMEVTSTTPDMIGAITVTRIAVQKNTMTTFSLSNKCGRVYESTYFYNAPTR